MEEERISQMQDLMNKYNSHISVVGPQLIRVSLVIIIILFIERHFQIAVRDNIVKRNNYYTSLLFLKIKIK